MVRRIFIPSQVKKAIKEHLNEAIDKAVKGFASSYEDEDVLTGHLFGLMKIEEQTIEIDDVEIGGTWKWTIDFKKFGGRGKGATESIIGADGIFELHLYRGNDVVSKSLLFQSKLDWSNKDEKLYLQCSKLLTWLGAAILINYRQDDFETYSIDQVLSNHGLKPSINKSLQELLGTDFLDCLIGDSDLEYDAFKKKLIWLDSENCTVATKFNINRRLKIKVVAPKRFPYEEKKIQKEILNEEISKHKLKNENSDYNIENIKTLNELRKVQNKVSLFFHPDRHSKLPDAQIDLLTDLMKYYNNKFDKQKEYIKRKNK